MSELEQRFSRRELVLAQREAWLRGFRTSWADIDAGAGPSVDLDVEARVAREYPLPKKRVPRVLTLQDGWAYRVTDGVIEYRSSISGTWCAEVTLNAAAVTRLADLLANPTEEIDDV